jgi:hypothetical protein
VDVSCGASVVVMTEQFVNVGWVLLVVASLACSGGKPAQVDAGSGSNGGASFQSGGTGKGGSLGESGEGGAQGGSGGTSAGLGGTPLELTWTKLAPKVATPEGALSPGYGYANLFVTSQDTVLGTRSSIGPSGLFRSIDHALTWSQASASTGARGIHVRVAAETGGRLLGIGRTDSKPLSSGAPTGLCLSSDDGATWSTLTSLTAAVRDVLVVSEQHWFAATERGVQETTDGGDSWSALGPDIGDAGALLLDANGTLHTSLREARARTRLDAPFWFVYADSYSPPVPSRVWAMADGSLLGTASPGLIRSLDFGDTWQPPAAGVEAVALFELRSGSHLAIVGSELLYSKDFGYEWARLTTPKGNNSRSIAQFADGSLLLGTEGDPGTLMLSAPFPGEAPVSPAPVSKRPATCYDGKLSAGETRVDCGGGCGVCEEWATYGARTGNGIFVSESGTWYSGLENDSLAYSNDRGLTWTDTKTSTPVPVAEHGGTLYALSQPGPVLSSSDAGLTWQPLDTEGRTVGATSSLVVTSKGTLYISHAVGLFASTASGGWLDLEWSAADIGSRLILGPADAPLALDHFRVGHLNGAGTAFEGYLPVPYREFSALGAVGDVVYLISNQTLFTSDAALSRLDEVGPVPEGTSTIIGRTPELLLAVIAEVGVPRLSKDGGKTWQGHGRGLSTCQSHHGDLAFTDDGRLVLACYYGLRVSRPIAEW